MSVALSCQMVIKAEEAADVQHAFCAATKRNLEHLGAAVTIIDQQGEVIEEARQQSAEDESDEADAEAVVDADLEDNAEEQGEEPVAPGVYDLKVTWIDYSDGIHWCGWSILPFLMTASYYPLVCDDPARAELHLAMADGPVDRRYEFKLHSRRYYGIGALYPWIVKQMKEWTGRDNSSELYGRRVAETVQNHVFTYARSLGLTGPQRPLARSTIASPAVAPPGAGGGAE